MRARPALIALAFGLSTAGCATAGSSPDAEYARTVIRADAAGRTYPWATVAMPALDLDGAYAAQHTLVTRRIKAGDAIAGYKGGLMSAKSLADRKVDTPLIGVLFRSGQLPDDAVVSLCGYRRPALELKFGFVFNQAVTAPIASVPALKDLVGEVVPVVELPDIAYADPAGYGALDMVAANISSSRYVRGAATRNIPDLDRMTVSIDRDGGRLTQGVGAESLGGQWASLLTLVNLLVGRGYSIRAGQLVLTGKIGDKVDVNPGRYLADYGRLGSVRFEVEGCRKRN